MQELRSTDILDKEIQADARKKAERMLAKADSDCAKLLASVETDIEKAAEEKQQFFAHKLEAFEKDRMAVVPLEKERFKVSFIQNSVVANINKYLEGLSEEKRLILVARNFDFKTDVARITFLDQSAGDQVTMMSVLYALLEGLSREMGIERTDIKGTLFRTSEDGLLLYSVILYDAVAGGAGHVRRLVTEDGEAFQRVLKRAFQVVNNCDCGSSCYKCLRNYYNQKIHDVLNRHKASDFLRAWIGDMKQTDQPTEEEVDGNRNNPEAMEIILSDDFGMNMKDSEWTVIWNEISFLLETEREIAMVEILKDSENLFQGKEKPFMDCQFIAGEEYDCALIWPDSQVMLFTEENRIGYEAAKKSNWTCFLLADESASPEKIAAALKEE